MTKRFLELLNGNPDLAFFLAMFFLYQIASPLVLAFDKQLAKRSPGAVAFLRASGIDVRRMVTAVNRLIYFLLRRYVPAIPPPPEVPVSEEKAANSKYPPPDDKPAGGPPAGIVMALWCFALACIVGCLTGCAEWQKPLDDAAASVRAASTVADRSEPCLFAAYTLEVDRCKALPDVAAATSCVESARERWRETREALAVVRRIRCQVDPAECVGQ